MGTKIVRRAYGTPFSKLAGQRGLVTKDLLHKLGKVLVESVVAEAKRDFALQGGKRTPHGEPEGIPGPKFKYNHPAAHTPLNQRIPDAGKFFSSFSYEIIGDSTVGIRSSWPWIEEIVEGRPAFKMPWLTQERGVYKVPIVLTDGRVIVRAAPLTTADAWIHPGFARHTFIQRGVRKGRDKAAKMVQEEIAKALLKGDPLRKR